MIVVSKQLVLATTSAAMSLAFPRIMWQNLARSSSIDATNVIVSSEADEGPRDAPLRPETAEYWLPTALPATWQVDLGTQYDIDYVGLVHTLGTSRCACKPETSPDASGWTALGVESMPADNAPLVFLDTVRSARFLRLTFTGATPPRIPVVYVGKALAMEMQIVDPFTPINMSGETVKTSQLSRGGQFLGQSFRRNGVSGNVPSKYLSTAFVRASFMPFVLSAREFPYFYAWNPLMYPRDVGYVWTDKDIIPSYDGIRDLMDVSWPIRGVGQA